MSTQGTLRVGVIGTGYLGAVHAACMAELGHDVVAVDVDVDVIAGLAAGTPHFFEPGLHDLLAETLASGRLRFTPDYAELAGCEVVFVCVGTPQRPGGVEADTSYVFAAVRSLAPHLGADALVVGKSTVPVGTAARLIEELTDLLGRAPRVAWNPEFLREGHAIVDTTTPSRLVYGVQGETAEADAALLDDVYASAIAAGIPRIVTDLATAELVKGAANAFLATKISFINTIADVCESAGGDVSDLARAIGLDERIGAQFLSAGVGFGGGCLPKDIRAFSARAVELGVPQTAQLLDLVDEINNSRRDKVVRLATEAVGGEVAGKKVAILGFAFKPNSDDTRDSPGIAIGRVLAAHGADVRLHDPRAHLPAHAQGSMTAVGSVEEALEGADVVLHLTEWAEYRDLDPRHLRKLVTTPTVIDGRNALDAQTWRQAGWTVRALGSRRGA